MEPQRDPFDVELERLTRAEAGWRMRSEYLEDRIADLEASLKVYKVSLAITVLLIIATVIGELLG